MNYAESLRYLDELNTFGIRLGLARMEELCARLGNPERAYTTIHIAGTNGKGSSVLPASAPDVTFRRTSSPIRNA